MMSKLTKENTLRDGLRRGALFEGLCGYGQFAGCISTKKELRPDGILILIVIVIPSLKFLPPYSRLKWDFMVQ